MTTEAKPPSRKWLAATIILAVLLASVVIVFDVQLTQERADANATVSNLRSTIASLQNTNSLLKSQLSALSGGSNSTLLAPDAEAIYRNANASVVTVQGVQTVSTLTFFGVQTTYESVLGSGFVIKYNSSYYIVTNYHVINGDSNISVTFWDGNAYPAKVIGTDPYSDLAVLTVNAPSDEFIPLQLTTSSTLVVGEPVFAIGNPYGLSGSFTYGIVSQLGRTIQESTTNGFSIPDIIQFTAPINPGNSGGPLLNSQGMVVGITTAIVSGSQGLGFAIPSDTILRELPSLISTGSYNLHPYLGITEVDMNLQLAQAMGVNVTYGVLVETVVPGGPASKAGLEGGNTTVVIAGQQYLIGGDIIVSVNGTRIINSDALSTYLEEHTIAGETVQLGIIRNGEFMTVSLTLGARPPP